MNQLEQLTADIREKLPRLKELEEGQVLKSLINDQSNDMCKNSFFIVGYNEDYSCNIYTKSSIEIGGYVYDIGNDFEIIGKEPMFNDVLEWHSKQHSKNSHFEVFNIVMNNEKHPAGVFIDYSEEDTARFIWNLSKAYLKDQSPELINYLHSLIKTKQ